jgi:hypothetical protein
MSRQEPSNNFSIPSPERHERKRPASERKILANRENALRSTGPKTARGKSYSRRNSLKHGLFAKDLFTDFAIQKEDPQEFIELLSQCRKELRPVGRLEELEVEYILVCWWKRARAWRYENAVMRLAHGELAYPLLRIDPRQPWTPEYQTLVPLLHSAAKEIETNGEISQELKQRMLDSSDWFRRVWPGFEEEGRRAALADPEVMKEVTEEYGIAFTAVAKYLTAGGAEERAARARFALLVPIKSAIAYLGNWNEQQFRAAERVAYELHVVPNSDPLDKILRYSGMIDRDLNRAYDRLERLQQRRKGESVPPSLNLNVNV